MSPTLFDTHCHLDAAEFAACRDSVVNAALTAGVGDMLVPAVSAASWPATLAMRSRYGCRVALGLHPVYLAQHRPEHLEQLADALDRERPDAVGEIGLDFYLPELDPAAQEALLLAQLKLARARQLPVVLHLRRAQDRVLKYLRQVQPPGGIAHAFNGSRQQADALIALGFKLGFGGAMSYSGSQRIRHLAATLPLSALVLETDAPDIRPAWCPPEQPNQPDNLPRFARILAELRGERVEDILTATTANARQALGLDGHAPRLRAA